MKVSGGEDGDIPESDAIVEMKHQSKTTTTTTTTITSDSSNKKDNNSYWMRDLYKYSSYRGYGAASGLYNLAWAQAVQNKPLNEVLVELDDKKNNKNASTDDTSVNKEQGEVQQHCVESKEVFEVVDSEKEEGELEEGEIDFDSDDTGNNHNSNGNKVQDDFGGLEMDDGELENQVSSIRKVLHNVTVAEAHKSFDIVCARLRTSLETLRELVLHTWFPSKDALIQQAFAAIQCVYSVYSSMSPTLRDQNKDRMSRLLTSVMDLSSVLFTPEQRKEVEGMITSVNPPIVPVKPKSRDRQEELPVTEKAILTDSNTLTVNTGDNKSDLLKKVGPELSVYQSEKKNTDILSEAMRHFPSSLKVRSSFGPLLDLHKVHDEDSLPSPTSKTMPSLPFFETAPPRVVHGLQKSGVHPYETEAVKAVSSYQQRFGRSTFLATDMLPSPTPSEDGNEGGADDSNEEVSSSSAYTNVVSRTTNSSVVPQPVVSSAAYTSSSTMQGVISGTSAESSSVGSSPSLRASAKSRDPRLRHLNPNFGSLDLSFCPSPMVPSSASKLEPLGEIMKSKKTKALEGRLLDGPTAKRPRNGLETEDMSMNANQVKTLQGSTRMETSSSSILGPQSSSRGLLGPAIDPRKPGSGTVSSGITTNNPSMAVNKTAKPSMNVSGSPSLQSLLKDIAGNPGAWMNIIKEQNKSSEPLQSVSHSMNSNSILGAAPSAIAVPPISSGVGQTSAGLLQVPSPKVVTSSQDDSAKLRMKPRDPRRALHANMAQRTGSSVPEQPKVNGVHNTTTQGLQENINAQRYVNGTSPSAASSQTPILPDITKQFTKNLKNIADIISSPQTSSIQSPLAVSSLSAQANSDTTSISSGGQASCSSGGPVITGNQRTVCALRPEEVVSGRPQSQNNWGDVEHLFDGYDDQQKAAIQQERARRLDEQNKMFADRKLCLVLDLDHTLLNSAKFSEVDPVHDEILRKKEEQDREKPRRHLFRFPHMAMWTKLRPGIWNFLEKASKLFELHLYTMGNKLYATEMAKVLDPKGTLFAGRVISRGDDGDPIDGDERVPKSKDLEGVMGMESSVVIIDDSARVWPHNKLNLIVVERYTYFPCSRKQFGLPGPSLLEIDHDERPEEGTLASSLAVIEKIHQNFFSHKSLDDVDVRNILGAEQRKILAGCRILFSRVFPVGEANPHLHPLWQTAEQFGAVCTNQLDEQVTHVVANSLGTDKVNWALSTKRFVVHPSWVEASALLYRRVNEQDFAIKT
ncbi:RNA polymerase II C-terminal domain phosphatase-like 3 [Beta vulgaris subsp. vulgaris]|uniref:RNA polymerase II C-terminal domain phosphatase-like 3 n=1 Tax=Beta vulgaris subsp. vulgaris TaxID=3555 RepID=UPI002036B177|nr:RNA polymerase II C-terminal domain phosphatase-like 3 [Beta vulgaris subsp. vulgaris]